MQALRHASRRALHASVIMQETRGVSVKAYSSEASSSVPARKSREERYELAKQFVTKFKAANNGQLPGITLLRKEVGGKYETLKEVLQELGKGQDEPDTLKQTVELKDAKEKMQEFAAAGKDGDKKKSTVKEKGSKIDKQETPRVSKGSKAVKSVGQAHSKTTSKDMGQTIQSVIPVKDASKPVTDTLLISDEDDDDDSDVAAPEYHHTPLIQMARHHKMEEGVKAEKGEEKVLGNGPVAYFKNDMKKQNDDQAIKSKHPGIKQFEVQDGGKRIELPLKGRDAVSAVVKSVDDTAAKHPFSDGSLGYGSKHYGFAPLTTVARITNLPGHFTASKLKALCESVARVHEVDLRRGRMADVQFDVDIQEMNDVLSRLRARTIGSWKVRVYPAHKFSCGNNANSQCKPHDVNHFKMVRDALLYSLEQRFRFLCWQVQDYRELQNLKLAR